MPRGDNLSTDNQRVKLLLIGDGKCGKSDYAFFAAKSGFDVLYLDGDVASATLASMVKENTLTKDEASRIYLLNVQDRIKNGGPDHFMMDTVANIVTSGRFFWNDTQSRPYSVALDGPESNDEIWEIDTSKLDEQTVLVWDSWTSFIQSIRNWVAEELDLDLSTMDKATKDSMRNVYQMIGEKANLYLQIIRSLRCHVIVLAHPSEFVKTEKPSGKTVSTIKETDLKVLWTKMVPKSASNNHSMLMAKYFTDLAWLEVSAMGDYLIDFRPSSERISGSHFNMREKSREKGSFSQLVSQVGGKIPAPRTLPPWLVIHSDGFQHPSAQKTKVVLGGKENTPVIQGKSLTGIMGQRS